jgi:hypothetical protein
MQHAVASENMSLKRFASAHGTIPDQVSFADARQLRSDILSLMRQGSTPDRVKRVEGEAVGLYNEAMRDAAEKAGVPEAMDMVEEANAIWKSRYEHFYNVAIESLVKKGERGPELVGSLVWQPGAITQTRRTLQALGGKLTNNGLEFVDRAGNPSPHLQKAWNITRRSGFEQLAEGADRATNPHKKWSDWWDKLDPDQRLLMANGQPQLKKSYDELFHLMRELDTSQKAKALEGLGLQSPEKTAMVYAALATSGMTGVGAGAGYLAGGTPGAITGAVGFLGLSFLGPRLVAKLLTSQAGTNLLIDGTRMLGTPKSLTAENVLKLTLRGISLAANTSEETARYEPKGLDKVPPVEDIPAGELPPATAIQ